VPDGNRDEQIATAQAKLLELQKTIDDETARRQDLPRKSFEYGFWMVW
jgi:hypothetical protein